MLATVTIKGQVTVPKAIRDQLKIERGTQLDFKLNDDGSISVRALRRSALSIVGLLKGSARSGTKIEQMNQAVADAAAERQLRSRKPKANAAKT